MKRRLQAPTTHRYDFLNTYVADLAKVIDLEVDPRIGTSHVAWILWAVRASITGRRLPSATGSISPYSTREVDPTFRFMSVDWDGRIRMDPSSPFAMQGLIHLKDRFDIAFACDTDHDRHGIVTRSAGLLPSNHYLAVCIDYLFRNRPGWSRAAGHRQDGGQQSDDRPRRGAARAPCVRSAGGIQMVRQRIARTDRSVSAARRAPAPRSCSSMAEHGAPTRTASSPVCCPRR